MLVGGCGDEIRAPKNQWFEIRSENKLRHCLSLDTTKLHNYALIGNRRDNRN